MALLENIDSPEDLKLLGIDELESLADEIRKEIIHTVSCTGGHLASNLGVVELTLALHYVFESPRDRIVWDVGHQCYTHKLVTGRRKRFSTLRQFKGISGFPKISESPHDHFGTGHSSTSISAALGMAIARDLKGEDYHVIAVIGDGAMTAGLSFEALNNAGQLKVPMIVVLNDNEMSISKNVGAISKYLNKILTTDFYKRFKKDTKNILQGIPRLGSSMSRFAHKLEETVKGFFLPGQLFEEFGFNYIGPIDGHNVRELIETFQAIRDIKEPILVHVITKKGRGYDPSEQDPSCFHGIGPFDKVSGRAVSTSDRPSYSSVFGSALLEIAEKRKDVLAITAAMKEGTGLKEFSELFPERFFDVGIAEPHAVTFAAGLAKDGYRPVVAIYSTFLQRAYDEIIHDVALQNLPVVFAIDRAGLVGEDGPTHHGVFDISYLRHIPNMVVMAPKDEQELKMMLEFAFTLNGPSSIRYPRGRATESFPAPPQPLRLGEAELLCEGSELALLAVGNMVYPAFQAAEELKKEGYSITVVNMRFIKPIDSHLIAQLAQTHNALITVEENALAGGFGSAVLETLTSMGIKTPRVRLLGIPDTFIEQGDLKSLRRMLELDVEGIKNNCLGLLQETERSHR